MDERTRRTRQRCEGLYACYARGDLASVLDALHPDVVWTSAGGPEVPWAGTFRGRAGVEAYFARLFAAARLTAYSIERVIADGDWVAVLATARAVMGASGQERDFSKADVMRIDAEGRVLEFREYYDTGGVSAALAAPATTAGGPPG